MGTSTTTESVETWLGTDGNDLPLLAQVATEIALRCEDPDTAADQLAELLVREPVLGARLLRLVNSAYYGLTQQVSSVRHAIALLGFRTVRTVALTAAVLAAFKDAAAGKFNLTRFWRHSLSAAATCRALADQIGTFDPETAFTLGLLHDIGKLVLVRYRLEDAERVIDNARDKGLSFYQSELDLLPATHPALGAWLIGRWRLPPTLVEGVAAHHDRAGELNSPLDASLEFADYLCVIMNITASGSYEEANLRREVWRCLGLKTSDLGHLIGKVNDELKTAQQLLHHA